MEYISLHPIRLTEIREIQQAVGLAAMPGGQFMNTFKESNGSYVDRVAQGHYTEIGRIVRKYLPSHISKETYKSGTKAWNHVRARLEIRINGQTDILVHRPIGDKVPSMFPSTIATCNNVYRAKIIGDIADYIIYGDEVTTNLPRWIMNDIDSHPTRMPENITMLLPNAVIEFINNVDDDDTIAY